MIIEYRLSTLGLVVEDEEKLARYLKNGLEESSYVVDLALNGTDGLHLATHESYDLIILDIMLINRINILPFLK